jgi:gamma-glutamylcyclotransferase (GGCT)/AIG2-like uncharacterized protein YtfP
VRRRPKLWLSCARRIRFRASGVSATSEFLFAYGTLQPGLAPDVVADVVRDLVRVGKGTVAGTLYDLGSFPGAVLEPDSPRRIWGTVYLLPAGAHHILHRLDEYEEYYPESPTASQFIRRLCSVQFSDGRKLGCWIYEYNGRIDHAPIVESGAYMPDRH